MAHFAGMLRRFRFKSWSYLHVLHRYTRVTYRIAGNFQRRKLSQILRFCGCSRKFSPRNLWAWCPLAQHKRAIRKSFLRKNRLFHQFAKVFSLESFPLYSTHDCMCLIACYSFAVLQVSLSSLVKLSANSEVSKSALDTLLSILPLLSGNL